MKSPPSKLILRRPEIADATEALVLLSDPDVQYWNPAPLVTDLETATSWCRRGADWSAGDHATWHVFDSSDNRFLANCSLFAVDLNEATARIGYRVMPQERGNYIARVSVDAVSNWAFRELGIARITLEHAVGNAASCHVALAAGFVLEGTLRSAFPDPFGVRLDCHVHGRLESDPIPQFATSTVLQVD